jgi:hypothetical protein
MNYEEAKAALDKLRPPEIHTFNKVQAAWLAVKTKCPEGQEPTRESVRLKVAGMSSGAVCRYLPIVQGLEAGGHNKSDGATGDDTVTVEATLRINAAIAAFVVTRSHKLIVADILCLRSTTVAQEKNDGATFEPEA